MGNASLASDELLPSIGELVTGKYRVVRLLGSGGMGSVLEARHAALGHSVALKILHQPAVEGDESSVRFFREARATASLESEHVVRIFDLGTTEQGLPFLVMERLSGFDLGDVLMRIGAFPPGLAVECVLQAARGVAHAHEAGIVHRDLKPSNLFLTRRSDGRPLIKVLDFGISKLQNDDSVRLTQTRTVVGSPIYMSPEQVRDARQVDARTDVWALGAILHELLSGRPAFDGDTLPSVYASIVTDEPAPLARDDVPEALREITLRCLTKDRQARLGSAEELARALEPLLERVPAPPLSSLELSFPARDREEDSRPMGSFPGVRSAVDTSTPEAIRTSATRKRMTPATSPTLSSGEPALSRSSRRWLPWSGLAVLLALGLAWGVWSWTSAVPAGKPSEPPAVARTHMLEIVSTPPGALVLEGGRVLGRTPFRMPMSVADTELRELVFEAEGFMPHAARVEPLTEDRTLAVALVPAHATPEPTPAPPIEAATAVPEPAAPARPRRKVGPSSRPSPSAAEAPSQGEIHLSR